MFKLKLFSYLCLIAFFPSLFAHPHLNFPGVQVQNIHTESKTFLTYDNIINLLDELESGELEKKCSVADLEQVNQFLALLAKEGVLPGEADLEDDVKELLEGEENPFEYHFLNGSNDYLTLPAVFNGSEHGDVYLCKSWLKKKWKQTKKFVKDHKKEIIIGAVVVVATVVIVVAVVGASSTGAAAIAGAAGAADSESSKPKEKSPDIQILTSALDDEIASFKERLAKEQFFPPPAKHEELSWEETGRVVGPLFAHESFNTLNDQISNNPQFTREIQRMRSHAKLSEKTSSHLHNGHGEIDKRFSTDYSEIFKSPEKEANFNALSYHLRGEKALTFGHYKQAKSDLGKAIELDPTSSLPYLERSFAHFGLGQYDNFLEDFHKYTASSPEKCPLSIPEFSLGFAKRLPKGLYESGHGTLLFLADLVTHPIHAGEQIYEALTKLSHLARSNQWSALGELLVPEAYQLIKKWDTLPSTERGEQAGYIFGKYGADIIIPGAAAKALSTGVKGAQELSTICRGLKTAERTLVVESIAGLKSAEKITKVIQVEKKISNWLGEGTKFIRNKAGDPVFLSKDGLKKVRFDFSRPNPHKSPHMHFEHLIDGEWQEISRIYPSDVPHK